ncbi:hypothetical protein [Pararhizobium sp.]|uniref:hypothetical protein n=1 Tax=Pararhizobium sp. TaxID=1977563 RepID=UPI00271BE6A1|nr:hypothetical protein [Pararhizobium sp.]MDO9415745.1 hypothetical protein [Pararhizobium sp.]
MKNVFAVAVMLAGAAIAGPASATSTSAEITAALVGNTFQGGMGGGAYSSYFGPDGMYKDASSTGKYLIENDAVCYPGTDFGCYQATIKGEELEWFKDGKSEGKGTIVKGDAIK